MITVHVNGVSLALEVDTGTKASVIGAEVYDRHFAHFPLRPTQDLVWGSTLKMRGECLANVSYDEQ